jgi:hypothetical protein
MITLTKNYTGLEHCTPIRNIVFEISDDATLSDLVESLEIFIRACGYHTPEGHILDFVCDEPTSDAG